MNPDDVVAFWFDAPEPLRSRRWWAKDPQLDDEIRARFGPLRERAIAGELRDWEADPRGRLSLILLVDQFSRNLFRDDPRAFAHDALARCWCTDGLAAGADRPLSPTQRVFFYLPLEHSEVLADQERAVALFTRLWAEARPADRAQFANYLDYARRHHDIVARFGRFPHRNALLGRKSTAAETAFLREPGSSF